MSNSQIEKRYGVPLPIDVLWKEIESRYGTLECADLQILYRAATKRYSRASELNRRRHLVAHWERNGTRRGELLARYKRSLEDPQAYIDGGDDGQEA